MTADPLPFGMEVKYSLRQSMWKKTKNVLELVRTTEYITLPGYHSSREVSNTSMDELEGDAWRVANQIQNGDLVVIFENGNRERALLVRIIGDVEYRNLPKVNIYRKNGYHNTYSESSDVIQVSLPNETPPRGYSSVEFMSALVRKIQVIGFIPKQAPIFQKYWKFQGHLQRNRAMERFIYL